MFESFAHFHGQIAIITEDGVSLSYEELDQLIEKFSANFSFGRGVALIECENSLNSIVAYLSALRAKCPAFLIASGQPDVSQNLLTQFAALYHINTRSNKITTYEETATDRLHSDLAVILSTSGSTGTAKSIRLSYRALEANAKSIVEYLSIDSTDRAPTTLPMQYSYGLSVINSHLLAGGSLVLTEKSVADREFWRLFDKYGCTSFAGVPHSYALIEKSGVKTAERTTLRYATQAGGRLEPNRVKSLAEQSQREGWRFFVMYGQTEATARMAYLPPEQALENPHCIGVPIPGGTFRLVDNHGVDLEGVDETGELVYTGDNVMMGYALGAEDLARGYELTELRTGDLACRTSNDLFQIVGRKKRFVKLYGLRISLDEVDGWLLDHGYSAVSTRCNDALWILTTTANDAPVIRDAIANWLILPPTAINVGFIEAIPRKANGKVDFSQVTQLAEQEAKKLEAATAHPAQKSKNNTVREIFASHFPNQEINSQSSFTSLGGTSLDYIEMMLALEKCVGDLPQNWYELSLLELEKKQTGKSFFQSVETQILLRSLAIVMIVIGHLTSFHYGGTGAVLLLMIAGFNFSRFQLPNILSTGSSRPILELVSIIVLPSIAYLLLLQSVFNSLHLPSLLLFSNLIEANANGGFSLWFIEVYVQILLILALLISFIPKERISSARQRPVASWLIIISILLYVLLPIAWDTTYLFNRVPHMLFWLFACGIGAQTLKSLPAKWMLSAAFMMAVYLKYGIDTPYKLLIYGGSLLIWLPRVKIPTILRQPIYQLANASLFIYLSHFQFNSLSEKIFGDQEWIAVVVALVGGVVTWKIYLACLPHFMKILSR
ncbi:MAG: AMP-binding protein [Leptolyngbyaceae cyanobacterium MO_188.B28]|nr:AMP-binding protein [Leptolyngbyaceae cyanobacterium MO_188.B28]